MNAQNESVRRTDPPRTDPPRTEPPRSGFPRGLVALNIGLVLMLGVVVLGPRVGAQPMLTAAPRTPGEYSLVGGETTRGSPNVVYVLDSINQELICVRWNSGNPSNPLQTIGYRDLRADATARAGR